MNVVSELAPLSSIIHRVKTDIYYNGVILKPNDLREFEMKCAYKDEDAETFNEGIAL